MVKISDYTVYTYLALGAAFIGVEQFDKVCTQFDSKGYLILSLSVAELDKVCTQFSRFQTLLLFSVTESVHNSRKSQLHNNNNIVHL